MPRTDCDKPLQNRLRQVVQELGSPSAAAKQLGLQKTLVWRFYNHGRAIPKSRAALEAALDAYAHQVTQKVESEINSETNGSLLQLAGLSPDEFRAMRKLFQGVVTMMDIYERGGLLGPVEASMGDTK